LDLFHAFVLQRNTIPSIKAALKEYDGCEFDVRLTRDRVPILFHNVRFGGKRFLDTGFKALGGKVDRFEDLLGDGEVVDLVNKEGKTLWIELKEDTYRAGLPDKRYCRTLGKRVTKLLEASELELEKVQLISFCPQILDHAGGIKAMPIVPYLNCASDSFYPHRNSRTIANMLTPVTRHIKWAAKKEYSGLLFSRLYFQGFFSMLNPPLKVIVKKYQREDFILGTDAYTKKDEEFFRDIVAITDHRGKRGKKKRKGPLVAHRGLGKDPPL
jgi:hypothetical protein